MKSPKMKVQRDTKRRMSQMERVLIEVKQKMWKNQKIRANKKSKNRENERKEPIENRKSKSFHFCSHVSGKKPKCFPDSDGRL